VVLVTARTVYPFVRPFSWLGHAVGHVRPTANSRGSRRALEDSITRVYILLLQPYRNIYLIAFIETITEISVQKFESIFMISISHKKIINNIIYRAKTGKLRVCVKCGNIIEFFKS